MCSTVLPVKVEEEIVKKVSTASNQGFGVTKQQLIHKVSRITKNMRMKTPFTKGLPGKSWWEGFRKRHQERDRVKHNTRHADT